MELLVGVLGRNGEVDGSGGGIVYGLMEGVLPRLEVGLEVGRTIEGACLLWYRSGIGRTGSG